MPARNKIAKQITANDKNKHILCSKDKEIKRKPLAQRGEKNQRKMSHKFSFDYPRHFYSIQQKVTMFRRKNVE